MNQLAPDHFDTTWLTKVSPVKENKRLRVNNIRKVVGSTVDYLKDVVGMQLTQFPVPDVNQVSVPYYATRRTYFIIKEILFAGADTGIYNG